MNNIKDLRVREEALTLQITKIRKAIEAFQEVCDHKFEPDGHDSHYNWEKCTVCGKLNRC